MRVLLVDDETNLRRLLARVLEKFGYEVVEFANGPEALAWAQEHPVDALVTDVSLTGLNGSGLAQGIAARNPELLVVFMSGLPFDIEAEQRKHRYCAYLDKPFAPRTLRDALSGLDEARRRGREG